MSPEQLRLAEQLAKEHGSLLIPFVPEVPAGKLWLPKSCTEPPKPQTLFGYQIHVESTHEVLSWQRPRYISEVDFAHQN